ncbi:acyl carrier protein [[Clostridium] aminophilum]|uniref:Phosphopantetheine attachment site n=1 Tax=[Clostridium] aminophilum TaxID=1526 RepID=A0A1I0D603_9FIRM|nr:acyl carrier protein [[Clostridium] aminophilum]MCR4628578.1 acyl carrier protein [Clostridium sp.]MDD6196513.1 acyl carrier protein [[Clostridium] aminophilum]SET27589.1 Phosphopantetheine attachment site [[Clostridium] aminophilum]
MKEMKAEPELKEVAEAIGRALEMDPEGIRENTVFTEDLYADSFDMAMILTEADETFGTMLPTELAETLITVRDLMDAIRMYRDLPAPEKPVRWFSGREY